MEMLKNKKVLGLVGIISLVIGTFLPYFKISLWGYSKTIPLWGYWEGKIVLALTLANALYIFKDWIKTYIPQLFENNIGRIIEKNNNPKLSLIPTILIACFAGYLLINIETDSEFIKHGLGFYVIWIGVFSLIGHALIYKGNGITSNSAPNSPQISNNNSDVVQSTNNIYPQQTTNNASDVKYCSGCGNQCAANAERCFMCGKIF